MLGAGQPLEGLHLNPTGTWYLLRFLVNANGGALSDSAYLFVNGVQRSSLTGLSLTSPVNSDTRVGAVGYNQAAFTENFDSLAAYNQDSTQLPNVWYTTVAWQPYCTIFNEIQSYSTLAPQASAAAVSSTNQWFWSSNTLYVYLVGSPASTYTSPGIQACHRAYAITRNNSSYFSLSHLTVEGANQSSVNNPGNIFVGQTGPNDSGESSGIQMSNISTRYSSGDGLWLDSVGGSI